MNNLNHYKETSITGLQFGTNQKVNLGGNLVFLKDSPVYEGEGYIYHFSVINTKSGDLVDKGCTSSLANLRKQAKRFKK